MGSECHFSRIFNEGRFLYLNEEPIREITICYPLQREEKIRKTPYLPKEPKSSDLTLQGTSFHNLIHFIFSFNHQNQLFLSQPQYPK